MKKTLIILFFLALTAASENDYEECKTASKYLMENPDDFISMVRLNSNQIHSWYYNYIDNSNKRRITEGDSLTYEEEFSALIKSTIKNEFQGIYSFNDFQIYEYNGNDQIVVTYSNEEAYLFSIQFLFQEEDGIWKLFFVKFNDDRKCNGRNIE